MSLSVDFQTWQRLVREYGLSVQAATELGVTWTRCAAAAPRAT